MKKVHELSVSSQVKALPAEMSDCTQKKAGISTSSLHEKKASQWMGTCMLNQLFHVTVSVDMLHCMVYQTGVVYSALET